jgi:hypothetical protein
MKLSSSQTLITGVYRTGSEYLSKLINCHPEISSTEYHVNLMRFIYGQYDPISDEQNLQQCLSDLNRRLNDRYDFQIDEDLVRNTFLKSDDPGYGTLYDILMSHLYINGEIKHWAEKNQLLWREIPDYLDIMPSGKAIVIIRDPRSVLVSFKSYTYTDPPAYLGAVFNCLDCMQHVQKFGKRYSDKTFKYVKYEDLAVNPLKETNKIFEFLEVDPLNEISLNGVEDAYGDDWKANSSFHPNRSMGEEEIQDSINRWVGRIESGEINLTEGVCGDIMVKFGYERSLEKVDWPEALRLFLGISDQITKFFSKWLHKGEGVEKFPTDPLEPENWEEKQLETRE